jgi:hypothetical protein
MDREVRLALKEANVVSEKILLKQERSPAPLLS